MWDARGWQCCGGVHNHLCVNTSQHCQQEHQLYTQGEGVTYTGEGAGEGGSPGGGGGEGGGLGVEFRGQQAECGGSEGGGDRAGECEWLCMWVHRMAVLWRCSQTCCLRVACTALPSRA